MPKLKRSTSSVDASASGFEIYDGPDPVAGIYPGRIIKCYLKQSQRSDNLMYKLMGILETKGKAGKEQYNGAPVWGQIVMAPNDVNLRKEQNFYKAIGASTDPDVVYDALDAKENPGTVKKIDGKNPVGVHVRFKINVQHGGDFEGPSIDEVFLATEAPADVEEDEVEEDEDEAVEDEVDYTELGLSELKAELKERGIDFSGVKGKAAYIALLEADDEAADDEDEEDGDDEEAETDYSDLSLAELKALAKERGIKVARGSKEVDIIDSLTDWDADNAESEEDDEEEDDEEDEDEDDAAEFSYSDIAAYPLPKLRKWCVEQDYEASDVKGMTKDEILAMLIEDEILTDAPPF